MAKLISAYAGITALQIKNKASIPTQGNMTVIGEAVSCVNIDSDQIGAVLGEADSSWAGLCQSVKVNPYSGFGPREWNLGAAGLFHSAKTPYSTDDFAGYNHQAPPPGISVDDVSAENTALSFNFYAFVSFGEVDYRDRTGAIEVVCKVMDGANVRATFIQDISASNYLQGVVFSGPVSNPSNLTNFTVQVYFAGAGHVKICDIPNIAASTPFTVTITNTQPVQNGIYGGVSLSADWDSEYPGAYLFEDTPNSGINASTDTYSIKILGIDTDGDGIADMTGITFPLYARKNGGALVYCGTIRPARESQVGSSGNLPFTIIGTDEVDFVIGV